MNALERAHRKAQKYCGDLFHTYYPEDDLKSLLKEFPRPNHNFMKAEQLDPLLETGIEDKVGRSAATRLMLLDQDLERAQEKVLRVLGPLLKLLTELDKIRKGKSIKFSKVEKLLSLVEKTKQMLQCTIPEG